jgi:hypothetical protein
MTIIGSDETVDEGEPDRWRGADGSASSDGDRDGAGETRASQTVVVGPLAALPFETDRSLVEKSFDVFFRSVLARLTRLGGMDPD